VWMNAGSPAPATRSTYEERPRSEPPTSAPHSFATSASALIPAPPIPTNQRRLPASGCKRQQLLSDRLGRVRLGHPPHRGTHLFQPRPIVDQRAHRLGGGAAHGL